MIGSSRTGFALRTPSLKAIEPAILKANSLESTSWYEPSKTVTLTSTTGKPAMTPFSSASLTPLSTAGMYSRGHDAADDAVDELVTVASLLRLDAEPDVAVLAAAAGLPDELAFLFDLAADRLAVGDLRLADVRLDLELALHAIDDDVEVQLAHAGNDGLAGFLVGADAERRVFLRERCSARPIFS